MNLPTGYTLHEKLYAGARSTVVRAVRDSDGLSVVLKTLNTTHATATDLARYRYVHQLTSVDGLDGCVRALDLLEVDGRPVLVMEDIGATSLDHWLAKGPLHPRVVCFLGVAVARALQSVHDAAHVHKDVNPRNVVSNAETGETRLVDFELAARFHGDAGGAPSSHLAGTLAYIAPEQTGRTHRAVDARSDLYSLGATLYQLLTGRPPFGSGDALSLVHAHIALRPQDPSELSPACPKALASVVLRLLEKEPSSRYQTASGLAADLDAIGQALDDGSSLDAFETGRSDHVDGVQLSMRLYGRDGEMAVLAGAWERAAAGRAELVLIGGWSGVGKTSLVRELQGAISARSGRFLAGKQDQLVDAPFAALASAVRRFAVEILSGTEAEIAGWRARLAEALGANAALMADLVPELATVLGELPVVPSLPPAEGRKRFQLVFVNLVRAIASEDQPLVLFVDDLQWADAATTELLTALLQGDAARHLLVVGSFRDNEVSDDHAVFSLARASTEAGVPVERIELGALEHDHVQAMVADALNADIESLAGLMPAVVARTRGNPFFIERFLKAIHDEGLLRRAGAVWSWDDAGIAALGLSDNVADLVSRGIRRLDERTARALWCGACAGDAFDLGLLARLTSRPAMELAEDLIGAIDEELIAPIGDAWRFVGHQADLDLASVRYRFLHDRMQEAAYGLVEGDERAAIHLAIGRGLLEQTAGDELDARVQEIVRQLNLASTLLTSAAERLQLAQLDLRAAEKALSSAAFHAARDYAELAAGLLPADAWESQRELAWKLLNTRALAAQLCLDTDTAMALYDEALGRAETVAETACVHAGRVDLLTQSFRYPEAIAAGLEALAIFGFEAPQDEAGWQALIGGEGAAVGGLLAQHPPPTLVHHRACEDEELLAQFGLLVRTQNVSYTQPHVLTFLTMRMVRLSIEHGNAPESPAAYVVYGMLMGLMQQPEAGKAFGDVAIALSDASGDNARAVFVNHVYANFVNHWYRPFEDCMPRARRAVDLGLENGQFAFGAFACMCIPWMLLAAGRPLGEILDEIDHLAPIARDSFKQQDAYLNIVATRMAVLRLMGRDDELAAYHQQVGSYDQVVTDLVGMNSTVVPPRVPTLMAAVILGDIPLAQKEVSEVAPLLMTAPGFVAGEEFTFYAGVFGSMALSMLEGPAREEVLGQVQMGFGFLQAWAASCPENHGCRLALMEAELAALDTEKPYETAELFDLAIVAAREAKNLPVEGLALEEAARFYQTRARPQLAWGYLAQARLAYLRWGAEGKVRQLEARFPELRPSHTSRSGTRTMETVSTTSTGDTGGLDVQTVIKASTALAEEIEPARLLERVLRIVIENAGADAGSLVLERDGELFVEAEGTVDPDTMTVLHHAPLAEATRISPEIVRLVARTHKPLLVHDAATDERFASTSYLEGAGVRSALAMPLVHQGQLVGVLYVENRLSASVFTEGRVALLKALSSQAATSIENAFLYAQLQASSESLKRRNAQLQEHDKLRDEFLARTSHELRTPLHGIIGITESLLEGVAGQLNDDARRNLAMVSSSGRRLYHLVNDILDLSALKDSGLELAQGRVPLDELIQNAVELCRPLARGKRLELIAEVGELPPAFVDRDRVEQVLINLVGNAIKFTERGTVRISVDREDDRLVVRVADTGIGIAPEHHERIFGDFEQADNSVARVFGGTGLGLSVARQLVELHGGTLDVESTPGVGSTFWFDLPVARGTAAPAESRVARVEGLRAPIATEAVPDAAVREGSLDVLVVDDEPVNLQVLLNHLSAMNYSVRTAASGLAALELVDDGRPDIVLLDVMMPGMDGYEVCRRLRARWPASQLPVILLTARNQVDDLVEGMGAGANDYVTKPFSSRELAARVRTHAELATVHRAVGRFVPRDFLDMLGRHSIVDVQLGDGVEQEMTVLFADIRGFTTAAEKLDPTKTMAFLNTYLGIVEPVIKAHEGFVDKFLGDGVLALFGTADAAVAASLGLVQATSGLSLGGVPLEIGVGLNTGPLMLGTVGSDTRMDTTVVSDAVNLASRIDELNKRYGTHVLLTAKTAASLSQPDDWAMRRIDKLQVRGRKEPVGVYDVYQGASDVVRQAREATRVSFEQAVTLFHERKVPEAAQLFQLCRRMDPTDLATQQYLQRCASIQAQFASMEGW